MILTKDERYKDLSDKEVRERVDSIIESWKEFLAINGVKDLIYEKDYFIHERNLYEVVKRVDKREVYYHIFHHIDKGSICEYKKVGLLAYWINTLKPFMVVKKDTEIYNCPNELFSLFLILKVLSKIYEKRYNEPMPKLSDNTIKDYIYNFKYCDLSREATILFVEMLASVYDIGMDYVWPSPDDCK